MRVHLKGVHRVASKGRTYYYAWRGGPRIKARPGTPDFIREYHEAHAERRGPPQNCLFTLIAEFKQSSDFRNLSERSKKDYLTFLALIEARFGTMPLKAVEDPRARGVFKEWRDDFADHPRKADHLWTSLSRVLSFGKDRGKLKVNVCERGGRLYEARRQEKVWSADHISRFMGEAVPELQLALVLALWTGQRQGDLLKLTWSSYENERLRVFQSKAQKWVTVPVGETLRRSLASAPRRATTILTGQRGSPWTPDGFRTEWRKACLLAGIRDVTFHDLRGTAVTRLALAACTVPEISAITGHSLKDAQAILDAHYLGGRLELAETALAKLEEKEREQNR